MITYKKDHAKHERIREHLSNCDFNPPLETYLSIEEYIDKILKNAVRFECWDGALLVGFVAAYCNDHAGKRSFVTLVSVDRAYGRRGIAQTLMNEMESYCKTNGLKKVTLEVYKNNLPAIQLYEKGGFVVEKETQGSWMMVKEV